jgi:hypothetical protein
LTDLSVAAQTEWESKGHDAVRRQKGAVAGDDLAKIIAWANAFERGRADKPAGASDPKERSHAN